MRGWPLERNGGPVLCLKLKAALFFQSAEMCGMSSRWKKFIILSGEDLNLLIFEFLVFCNKRRLHSWKWTWCLVSACAGMQSMWKDEVGWEKGRFASRNVGVKVENVLPADLLLHSAPALLQCTRSDLLERLRSFHFCLFRVLPLHLHLHRAPHSQCWKLKRVSAVLAVKTEPCAYHTISSSCYVSPPAWSHSV